MELILYGFLFLACAGLLYVAGELVIVGLMRLSKIFGIREFVLAFFVMAGAASLPNLFVGVMSALEGIPELSLGDVFGNNIIAMTAAVTAGVFFSRKGRINTQSETVRTSLFFTLVATVAPVILLSDGLLGRGDGLILIAIFLFYVRWLVSQEDRFSKKYHHEPRPKQHFHLLTQAKLSFKYFFHIILGILLLLLAAVGIVTSASFFASHFGVSLVIIGILIVGLGNALPEVYFSVASARRGETALIMGNLMGSVIVPATLVLGIVALIHPSNVSNFEFVAENRIFLIVSAVLFFIFGTTKKHFGKFEAIILGLVYVSFVVWTIAYNLG